MQVRPMTAFLNSCFHYILRVPAALIKEQNDQIICWVGKNSDAHYNDVIEEISRDIFGEVWLFPVCVWTL